MDRNARVRQDDFLFRGDERFVSIAFLASRVEVQLPTYLLHRSRHSLLIRELLGDEKFDIGRLESFQIEVVIAFYPHVCLFGRNFRPRSRNPQLCDHLVVLLILLLDLFDLLFKSDYFLLLRQRHTPVSPS